MSKDGPQNSMAQPQAWWLLLGLPLAGLNPGKATGIVELCLHGPFMAVSLTSLGDVLTSLQSHREYNFSHGPQYPSPLCPWPSSSYRQSQLLL